MKMTMKRTRRMKKKKRPMMMTNSNYRSQPSSRLSHLRSDVVATRSLWRLTASDLAFGLPICR